MSAAAEAEREADAVLDVAAQRRRERRVAVQRAASARFGGEAEDADELVLQADAIAPRGETRVADASAVGVVMSNADEAVRREAEQERAHHRHLTERLEDEIGVRRPRADVQVERKSRASVIGRTHDA